MGGKNGNTFGVFADEFSEPTADLCGSVAIVSER
jgi:hypothetical protein